MTKLEYENALYRYCIRTKAYFTPEDSRAIRAEYKRQQQLILERMRLEK